MGLEWTSEDNFKINNVIMNPPYQDGLDAEIIIKMNSFAKDNIVSIQPSKWQTADDYYVGADYNTMRQKVVNNISTVIFYPDCKDVFDIWQADGITIINVNKHKENEKCNVINKCSTQKYFNSTEIRDIRHRETLLNCCNSIIKKLGEYTSINIERLNTSGKYQVFANLKTPGGGFYSLSKTNHGIYGLGLARLIDIENESKTVEESKLIFASDNKQQCENFLSWFNSKFVRFLIIANISKLNGTLTNDYFRFVPDVDNKDFNTKYDDKYFYTKYNLSEHDIELIEYTVKERHNEPKL